MRIIKNKLSKTGCYPPIRTWNQVMLPDGYVVVPDHLDTSVFYAHNGFVNLEVKNNVVVGMTANLEAWESWKSTLPDESNKVEQPSQLDIIEAQITYTAMMTDTLLEV